MNDSEGLVGASGFDPQQLILRAKRRRNFSERFDSFSDAYVWVLAALVALAYLFSAIFGLIFALLGQGVAHPKMPTAVWSLQELSPILLVLAAIWLLRLLLHLGPVAVNAATADWWLPLPLSSASLRARALRKALLFGMLASAFAGVLWLIVLYGLTGAFDPLLAGCALACFVLAGLLLANAGVIVQSFGLQSPAQRWLGRSVMAIIAVLAVSWGLLAAENQWTMSAVQGVAASILQLRTWTYASAILLPLGIIGTWWAMQPQPAHWLALPSLIRREATAGARYSNAGRWPGRHRSFSGCHRPQTPTRNAHRREAAGDLEDPGVAPDASRLLAHHRWLSAARDGLGGGR
ncbi:hypothetical protein AAHB37_02260 [Glutamicibacter halophytocola]|uniref:hypothetical protein n=1 Tax=Glutamicibacter halophytocola TaxID=1933880 RepID=UPI00321ADB3A